MCFHYYSVMHDFLQDRPLRQASQSVGSYQQYQQYREDMAKLAAVNAHGNNGPMFATSQSPSHHSFPMSIGGVPLPSSFFTSDPTPLMLNSSASSVSIPLPQSFYVNGGSAISKDTYRSLLLA